MYTGELLTAERATCDKYLSSNASWDEPAPRTTIEALHEEEEEEEYIEINPSFRRTIFDEENKFSASLPSQSTFNGGPSKSPHAVTTAPTRPHSASPAASFLSFFNNPAPEAPKPDDEGQVVAGYILGSIIGYGSSSIIRRTSSSSGAQAAVKIIRRSDLVKAGNAPQARRRLQHEADVWASLSHEHILPLFSAVHTPYADYFFTLYCPAGSLFDILKRDGSPALPQDDAGTIFRQIVRGMRYLHEVAGYVHRDMKLENVLVDEMGVCKIGDFGMSRKIGSVDEEDTGQEEQQDANYSFQGNSSIHRAQSLLVPSTRRHIKSTQLNLVINRHSNTRHRNSTSTNEPNHFFQPGSLPYAAPELLLPQTSEALRPHPSQDIWALGITLYALLTGRLPFHDSFEPRLQMKILNGTYEVPQGIGRGAERILQGCLDRFVANRWTIAMVDEIAWGVGWGAEGDDATPTDSHDNLQSHCESAPSRSRSHSRPADIHVPTGHDWQQDEPKSRSSMDAASRRSSSRAQRSLSRVPVLGGRSTSAKSVRRSISRQPRGSSPAPSIPADPYTPSIMTASSGPYSAFFDDSALDLSPAASSPVERGRRQIKFNHSNSRSPSPSVVPTTPIDSLLVVSSTDFVEQPDELHLDPESSRGRSTIRSLDPEKMQMRGSGIAKQLILGFDQEIGVWAPSHDIEHDMEQALSSNNFMPRSITRAAFVGTDDSRRKLVTELSLRQRPSSSPPIAPRLQQKESWGHNHNAALEPFLNTSPASSNTNLALRSRSAENGSR